MTAAPRRRGAGQASRSIAGLLLLAVLTACGQDGEVAGGNKADDGARGAGSAGPGTARAVPGADELVACPAVKSRPPATGGLPDVSLPCLGAGPDVRLADLRGPLLVNVWAQWCGPCRDEAPYLAALQQKAAGRVGLLGIDYADPRPELAVRFAVEHRWTYPHLADAGKQLAGPLRMAGPPLTAFVDVGGAVKYVHRGPFRSQLELDQLVRDKLGVTP